VDELTHLLNRILESAGVHPLVTLEEYFVSNVDQLSIGDHRHITPLDFCSELKALRDSEHVFDVRVEINPSSTCNGWPSTDTVWVVTSCTRSELPQQLSSEFWDRFLPDDWLSFPRLDGRMTEELEIPNGMCAVGFYYY